MLRNLKRPFRRLDGMYCKVLNEDAPEAVAGTDYRFDFDPENTRFDESQMYYAVDEAHEYFREPGFRGFRYNNPYGRNHGGQIAAVVHVGTNYDNAFYRPATGMIYFGDGSYNSSKTGLKDLSKEVDVVVHEFTHAVIDEYRPGIDGIDGAALYEGYSDYFACSYTDDPHLGDYVVAAPGAEGIIRSCENNQQYPGSPTAPHARGKVWAGACWDLRKKLGKEVADYLVFGSIFYLPRVPTFTTAKRAIQRIDQIFCGGEYANDIRELFERDRGIPA